MTKRFAQFDLQTQLLALGVVHLVAFAGLMLFELPGISGVLYSDGRRPVGGDFINLWSAARLILEGRIAEIYDVKAFMAFQDGLTGGANIGLRLWAYPPHSLLFAWPLGLVGFYVALLIWSCLGLAVLAFGAARFGFDRVETAIILTSPATVLNLYYGQSGSLATGLLLLALSPREPRGIVSAGAAALLTVKPQAGLLIPVIWAFQRRWRIIIWTTCGTLLLVGLAVAAYGIGPWMAYVGETLPVLSGLEREGSGPFMTMIPSMFMSVRIVADNADLAIAIHLAFAILVAGILLLRLWQVQEPERQAALVLIATVLITPYMHNYDLAILTCGALLVARRRRRGIELPRGSDRFVVVAWALPHLVVLFNMTGVPISPFLILLLLLLA